MWSQALVKNAREFPLNPLEILEGNIPEDLNGTLYRNGPALLHRGDRTVGHWFDGDGAILAVRFRDRQATAVYRYVQTAGYQKENTAERFLFPNYGTINRFWQNWGKPVKNSANTSVLALPDRLLALWEGGHPHALDLENLTTIGKDNLSFLTEKQPFSAHPKVDPDTGEIFNFGMVPGKNGTLVIYRLDRYGKILKTNTIPLQGIPLIHDFVIAGPYLLFCIPPVRVNFLPVALGWKSFSETMEWKPELGTEIIICDRDTLEAISRQQVEPWYQWHFANGCTTKNGAIAISMIRYENFSTNEYLKEVASGQTQTTAKGTLWEMRIDPHRGKLIEMMKILDRPGEFPLARAQLVGKPWRYTYLSLYKEDIDISKELLGEIARYDQQTDELSVTKIGDNCYPSEPIHVSQNGTDSGWLLTVVYDGNTHNSEVHIYDADHLQDKPISRLLLPQVIPPSFHGTWVV
jgi:carotenoid cleavage dioxygenase-like enzyme